MLSDFLCTNLVFAAFFKFKIKKKPQNPKTQQSKYEFWVLGKIGAYTYSGILICGWMRVFNKKGLPKQINVYYYYY